MVEKIIACADIHFPAVENISDLERQLEKFYAECEKIVEETGKEKVRIVVAGDIFHNKINVTNESNMAVYRFFKRLNEICKTIIIIGNHDFLMNNMDRVDSLTPILEMSGLENVVYLDALCEYKSGCVVDDNIVWCLYSSFSTFAAPDIKAYEQIYPKDKFTYVGVVHGEINGATTDKDHITKKALSAELFKGCDCVIAGHIHKRQKIVIESTGAEIVYCSSLMQQNIGETVRNHGYVVWDIGMESDAIGEPVKKVPSFQFKDIPDEVGGHYKFKINNIDAFKTGEVEFVNLG